MNSFLLSGLTQIQAYLTNRRRQLQDWDGAPPHKLGFVVLGLVVFELALARDLFHNLGLSPRLVSYMVSLTLIVFLVQTVLLKIASETAKALEKKGDWKTGFTFFSLGLLPFLLFLPVTVLMYMVQGSAEIRLLIFLVLILTTLGNWRESLEVCFELNRLQSALVLWSGLGLFVFLIVLFSYISLLASLADLRSLLSS